MAWRNSLEKFLVVVLVMLNSDRTVTPVFGAKILFIPNHVNSHVLYFSRLAADLTQFGHVTRVLAPANARVPSDQFRRGGRKWREFQLHEVPGGRR